MDLSIAEFKDMEGNVYILLLNRNLVEAHKDVIHLRSSYRLYDCMVEDGGVPTISNSREFNLQVGDAALYRLQNVNQKPEYLRYTVIK